MPRLGGIAERLLCLESTPAEPATTTGCRAAEGNSGGVSGRTWFVRQSTDPRCPTTTGGALLPKLSKRLFGKLFGDKGDLSQPMFAQLLQQGVELITKLKANMKNRLMSLSDKLLLRKRAIIESITDQLKNISQIEHSRHRSPINFCVNLVCGLIAYCHQPKKPSLHLDWPQLEAVC